MADTNYAGIFQEKDLLHVMRPEDVFSKITTLGVEGLSGNVRDMRTVVTSAVRKSDVVNSVPACYTAKIIDSYKKALLTQEAYASSTDIVTCARGYASESPVGYDPFITALSKIIGEEKSVHQFPTHQFTWEQLLKLTPTLVPLVRRRRDPEQHEEFLSSATWIGTTPVIRVAQQLGLGIGALAKNCGLSVMRFSCNNRNPQGKLETKYHLSTSWTSSDTTGMQASFQVQFEQLLVKDLTHNGLVPVALEVEFQTFGGTRLVLQWDDQPATTYYFPTCCDALLVPVLTKAADEFTALAIDFEMLLDLFQLSE